MGDEKKTPLLDELEKGPWPSFVKEIKQAGQTSPVVRRICSGSSSCPTRRRRGTGSTAASWACCGYGGGVIGRYSDVPDKFPNVAHFHTLRVNQPAGWFYTSDGLRTLCDIWERHGSALTNMHGSTGDIIFLGTRTDELEPTFKELTEAGFDLGGSGSACARRRLRGAGALRVGLLRHDGLCYDLTQHYQDEMHRPAVPLQVQDQVRRLPQRLRGLDRARRPVDHRHLEGRHPAGRRGRGPEYAAGGLDIQKDVCDRCPTKCMEWDGEKLTIENQRVRALHALHQRHAQGAAARQGSAARRC